MLIYLITNLANGKVYVGLTTKTLKKRWTQHKQISRRNDYRRDYPLYRAMRESGIDNFTITIIEECATKEELKSAEIRYIARYESQNPTKGYNVQPGGNLFTHTDETREKLSRGRNGNNNYSAKLSWKDVRAIRDAYANGTTKASLSRLYNVYHSTIREIVTGHSWKEPGMIVFPVLNRKPRKRLTQEDVDTIRSEYVQGQSRSLAERYGVSQSHINAIVAGIYWKTLDPYD